MTKDFKMSIVKDLMKVHYNVVDKKIIISVTYNILIGRIMTNNIIPGCIRIL